MKKRAAKITTFLLALIFCFGALIGCGGESENPSGGGSGSQNEPPAAGEISAVTILYNGEEVGDTLNLMYDDKDATKNVYTFTVRVDKTGEVDEVEEMVFWTADNASVAELADNETEAKVTLQGRKGTVTITVSSLLHSDTIYDSVTLNISVPAYPMETINGLGTYRLEAEDADLSECVYAGTKPGGTIVEETTLETTDGVYAASGDYVIGNLNKKGNKINFCVSSEKTAKAEIVLMLAASTYRSNDDKRSIPLDNVAQFSLDGEKFTTGVNFNVYKENTWFRYDEYAAPATLDLKEGVNNITIEVKTDTDFTSNSKMPNIDYMKLNVVEYAGEEAGRINTVTIQESGAPAVDKSLEYDAANRTITYTADVEKTGSIDDTVEWSTDNEAIATVDGGIVTLHGVAGSVTITATSSADSRRSDSVTITVTLPIADSVLSVTLKKDGADAGQNLDFVYSKAASSNTMTLTAAVEKTGGAAETVTWSTNDDTVATVTGGVVTFTGKAGEVTISATSSVDTAKSDSVTVSVISVMSGVNAAGTYRLQAEDAAITGGKVESTDYADGGKTVGSLNSKKDKLIFSVFCNKEYTATFKLRIAPSTEDKPPVVSEYDFDVVSFLFVNDAKIDDTGITVVIPQKGTEERPKDNTGADLGIWFCYKEYTATCTLDLKEGYNKFEFQTKTENGCQRMPNFDWMELTVADKTAGV